MANVPVKKGQLVGFNSQFVEATRAAFVIDAPKVLPGAIPNFDQDNVPQCIDLLVATATGFHLIQRVRHVSYGDPEGWIELEDSPEWEKLEFAG